ncbi:helix-turn-helix domain-containing protein [Neobacillus niacini]|uniref:helix-turn-helix domain-containing protein n=1 Tax=Neobacillus niacini TaxID=86668 RepID=UPI003982D7C7
MKRKWLIKLRKLKNMTQKEVSMITFIDRSYYTQIENGKRTPSIAVAKAIAEALEFDPLLFFYENIKGEYQQDPLPDTLKISEILKKENNSQILYLTSNFENYFEHVITFILIAYEKGNHYIVFDSESNLRQIKQKLKFIFPEDDFMEHIHYINHATNQEEIDVIMSSLITNLRKDASLLIWGRILHDSTIDQTKLTETINLLKGRNILFTCVYDSSLLSAYTQLELMRSYPFLMTDHELVRSPLFKRKDNTDLFPQLFIQ